MSNPFINNGVNVTSRISFNTGTLDFGNNRFVQVDSLTLSMEFSNIILYVLGSIIGQDHVRHSAKATLSGKIKSFSAEADALAYGSSVLGTPNNINVLDGQPTLQNPVLTCFDRNNKQFQYQFTNALFKSSKVSLGNEKFAEFDFDLEATQVAIVYTQ